jgi:CRISPR-associated protein Cmr6
MSSPLHPKAVAARRNLGSVPGNTGLIFDRFAETKDDNQSNLSALKAVCDIPQDTALHAGLMDRWRARAREFDAVTEVLETAGRFVSGVGINSVYEVGFRFDRYGFPTIPGSALKGVARTSALRQLAAQLRVKRKDYNVLDALVESGATRETITGKCEVGELGAGVVLSDAAWSVWQQLGDAFGTVHKAGQAVFFDAIPVSLPKLAVDVINPHHGKYYTGNEKPTAWQSPVPVHFLTVMPGSQFAFAISWRTKDGASARDQVMSWLLDGLKIFGIGAKTNAGYGRFRRTPPAAAKQPVAATLTPEQVVALPKVTGRFIHLQNRGKYAVKVTITGVERQIEVTTALFPESQRNALPGNKANVLVWYEINGDNVVIRQVARQ